MSSIQHNSIETDALIAALQNKCAALIQERDELKRDAERYRWLRGESTKSDPDGNKFIYTMEVIAYQREQLDAAIDAAMKEAGK